MKFWQLMTIFRDETKIIEDEISKKEWVVYLDLYKNHEFIVRHQIRNLLDMKVDEVLIKNIGTKSKKKIYCTSDNCTLYSYKNRDTDKEFTMSEAIDLFDHDIIEEVFETSYALAKRK